jgi:hypothetical protein
MYKSTYLGQTRPNTTKKKRLVVMLSSRDVVEQVIQQSKQQATISYPTPYAPVLPACSCQLLRHTSCDCATTFNDWTLNFSTRQEVFQMPPERTNAPVKLSLPLVNAPETYQ